MPVWDRWRADSGSGQETKTKQIADRDKEKMTDNRSLRRGEQGWWRKWQRRGRHQYEKSMWSGHGVKRRRKGEEKGKGRDESNNMVRVGSLWLRRAKKKVKKWSVSSDWVKKCGVRDNREKGHSHTLKHKAARDTLQEQNVSQQRLDKELLHGKLSKPHLVYRKSFLIYISTVPYKF